MIISVIRLLVFICYWSIVRSLKNQQRPSNTTAVVGDLVAANDSLTFQYTNNLDLGETETAIGVIEVSVC
jgi:hypothetical protein